MEMRSFIYDRVEYQVKKVEKLNGDSGEERFQVHTIDDKIFVLKYNPIVHQWTVKPN